MRTIRTYSILTAVLTAAALTVAVLLPASAADRASEIVGRLAAEFRAMKSYEVRFELSAEEFSGSGSYAIDGTDYCLKFGDAEVFADAATRWEVDNRRREVTIVEVDPASRNILNNPVRAFDFLGSEYLPTLVSEAGGQAVVRLTPAASGEDAPAGSVEVTVSTSDMRPLSLVYDYDGEQVAVRILRIAPLSEPLGRFELRNYDGYELIDFR